MAVGADMVVIGGRDFGCCGDAADEGWVRAYTLDGEPLWIHDVEGPGALSGNHDGVGDVALGTRGRVYLTGWVESRPRGSTDTPVDLEILVQKLSHDGQEVWTRVRRDDRGRDADRGVSIAVNRGELVVAAYPAGGWLLGRGDRVGHVWLGRFTFDGRLRWSRTWGIEARRAAQPEAVTIGSDGTIYVVGAQRDPGDDGIDAFTRAYSPSGRLRWRRPLGSHPLLWATGVDEAGSTLAVSGYRIDPQDTDSILAGIVWSLWVESRR